MVAIRSSALGCDQTAQASKQQQQQADRQRYGCEQTQKHACHHQNRCRDLPGSVALADQLPGKRPDDGGDDRLQDLQGRREARHGLPFAPKLTQHQHGQKPWQQKAGTTDDAADPAAMQPAQVNRHLAGYRARQASGAQALHRIALNPPSVLLNDVIAQQRNCAQGASETRADGGTSWRMPARS